MAAGASCQIGVRFAPQAQGPSSATLTVLGNAGSAPRPSGSVRHWWAGAGRPRRSAGAQRSARQGRARHLQTRHEVRAAPWPQRSGVAQAVQAKLVSGPIKFNVAGGTLKAAISRGHVVYASGRAVAVGGTRSQLVLTERHAIRSGRYTLISTERQAHPTTTTHSAITID